MQRLFLMAVLFAAVFSSPSASADVALDAWDRVLSRFEFEGGLDYAALAKDRADLDEFLDSLKTASLDGLGRNERMTLWINAYNAVTVFHVLERYPDFPGAKEVDGFFDKLKFPVAGKERTLDEIEDLALSYGDPRVHFAVVCASSSCPGLRGEAYRSEKVGRQLDSACRSFLADSQKGLRYDRDTNSLYLSSIFKWYAGDFTGGSTVVAFFARGAVLDWVIPFAKPELRNELEDRRPSVKYLEYDWAPNDRPGTAR